MRLARLVLLVCFSIAVLPSCAQAAVVSMWFVRGSGPAMTGEFVHVQIFLDTEGPQAPGSFTFTLDWGSERDGPEDIGALLLRVLPTAGPYNWLPYEADCIEGLHQPAGTCTMTVTFDETIDGAFLVAELTYEYNWVFAEGWEICPSTDPDCQFVPVNQKAWLLAAEFPAYGDVQGPFAQYKETLTAFGVKPVTPPEPTPLSGPVARVGLVLALAILGAGLQAPRRTR